VIRFIAPWGELINIEDSPDTEIRQYMTARPVSVAPTAPIGALAQMMVDAHIHRVLVVVDQNRPCGIVTSTDILAAVAREARGAPQASDSKSRKRVRSRH
jgi:CBS domain-containing protein